MRRIEVLNNPLVWIIGGALIASWFYGVFHTYKKHDGIKVAAALLLPPYGLYMAAEQSFGHSARAGGKAFTLTVSELIERNAATCRESESWQRRTGLGETQFAAFCICIGQFVIDNFPSDENEYVDKYGKNSPRLDQVKTRAMDACLASSRYPAAL
jgi:hypothetical protein